MLAHVDCATNACRSWLEYALRAPHQISENVNSSLLPKTYRKNFSRAFKKREWDARELSARACGNRLNSEMRQNGRKNIGQQLRKPE
jgi:hypothetical protein